jgi:hypothetical protein
MNPEYLLDVTARPGEVNLRNRSLELTRRSRALKLWLTFRTYGHRPVEPDHRARPVLAILRIVDIHFAIGAAPDEGSTVATNNRAFRKAATGQVPVVG